jgi:rfaE bifunctional protein nucleotidyltransferase chain/domain
MPLTTLDDLVPTIDAARHQGRRIGLANGVFELLHVGHARYLHAAAAACDVLVVAVNSDASARRLKPPPRPVVPAAERAELVAALRAVDWVVVFDEPDVGRIVTALRPDLHFKGTDYTPASVPERAAVEAHGGRVAIVGDPKDHAVTDLFARVAAASRP